MTTLRAQLINQVLRTLNAGRDPGTPEATTRRWLAGDDQGLPAISVWYDHEVRTVDNRSSRFGGPEDRALRFAIQAINSTVDADLSDEAVEPMVRWIDDQLGNTTLDDLAHKLIVERITWEAIQSDRLYVIATFSCLIQYQTTRGDSSRHQ